MLAFITWRAGQDQLRTSQDEVRTSREQLATVQEAQVTDRYTKAAEQLGSTKRDVRTAAIYALERIAKDSERDRLAIRDVLAAFTREHDPGTRIKDTKLPKEPDTDIQAALTVLGRRPADPHGAPRLDLHGIRTPAITFSPGANLNSANLNSADLTGADLRGIVGLSDQQIRVAAEVDTNTEFGPLPKQ